MSFVVTVVNSHVIAASAGGVVRVLDATTGKELAQLVPFPNYTGEIRVAAGDIDGDNRAEILVGRRQGRVSLFSAEGTRLASTTVYPDFNNGVRVGMADRDGDGKIDLLLAAPGPDRDSEVILFDTNLTAFDHLVVSDKVVTSGVFVAG
jgi:hypothetical protein